MTAFARMVQFYLTTDVPTLLLIIGSGVAQKISTGLNRMSISMRGLFRCNALACEYIELAMT
jgi:hypothetical protein